MTRTLSFNGVSLGRKCRAGPVVLAIQINVAVGWHLHFLPAEMRSGEGPAEAVLVVEWEPRRGSRRRLEGPGETTWRPRTGSSRRRPVRKRAAHPATLSVPVSCASISRPIQSNYAVSVRFQCASALKRAKAWRIAISNSFRRDSERRRPLFSHFSSV